MRRPALLAVTALASVGLLVSGLASAGAVSPNDAACRKAAVSGSVSHEELLAYDACRFDKLDAAVKSLAVVPTPTPTPTPSATPTPTPSPTPSDTPTPTPSPEPPATADFPTAATTGVSSCPTLAKVNNGDEVAVTQNGAVVENVEYLNPVVMNIRATDVTVRCVKFNGTGYFGIDNTVNGFSAKNTVVDQVDMSCQRNPQIVGLLLQDATATRLNVHDCDHMVNIAGSNVTVADSYCHDLTDAEVVHADCIQDTGGHDKTTIRGNAFYSRDTSDVLLGQEGGDGTNYLVEGNLFSSVGSPPPAFMLYLSGTNTTVKDNVFDLQRDNGVGGFTYGHCTDNTGPADYTWTGNTDETGKTIEGC